jgi:hypothetical protein
MDDKGLEPGVTYYYAIAAYDWMYHESPKSVVASKEVGDIIPPAVPT